MRMPSLLFRALPILLALNGFAAEQPRTNGPKIYLKDAEPLRLRHVGDAANRITRGSQPISIAIADIDADGFDDLIVGYDTPTGGVIAVHRGNSAAFAAQTPQAFEQMRAGIFPSPFLEDVETFTVPVRPDFIALGNFTGQSWIDLLVASRDDNRLFVFEGDGRRNFGEPQVMELAGSITSLAVLPVDVDGFSRVVAGFSSSPGAGAISVYKGDVAGLTAIATRPVDAVVDQIAVGATGYVGRTPAALLAGGRVYALSPGDWQLVAVPVSKPVIAVTVGPFVFDRGGSQQIAALTGDGDVQFVGLDSIDSRPYSPEEFRQLRDDARNGIVRRSVQSLTERASWHAIETLSAVAPHESGRAPVMLRTRMTGNGADDLLLLDHGRMIMLSRPNGVPGDTKSRPSTTSVRQFDGTVVAALAARVTADARPGLITLVAGEYAPRVIRPLAVNNYTVTGTTDNTTACTNTSGNNFNCPSVRSAVLAANSNPGSTINIPAGTYTLSLPKVTNDYTGNHGALYLLQNGTTTIIGAGQGSTFLQAGTTQATGVDMVMSVNEDITSNTNASLAMSGITLQNGNNLGKHGNDGDGGCMEFDTGVNGTATMNLTNVTLQNCRTNQGSGGGLANFNFVVATGTGFATINNCVIQNNSVNDNALPGPNSSVGGGIWVSDPSRIQMTASQVLNNSATQTSGGSGEGGGLFILSKGTPGEIQLTQIHSSTISNNLSSFGPGGIWDTADLLLDQGSVVSSNKNGQNGAGAVDGGGLWVDPSPGLTATLTNVTITGNQSTGRGGGINTGNGGSTGTVVLQFSRLTSNTAASTGSNLENLGGTTTATNNWWGTNAASSTIHTTGGTTTFDPFIVLTHTPNPEKIRINQSTTLTGDMSKDNHGSGAALTGNLGQLATLPITFDSAVLGSIPQAQPEALSASAQATATFNAGATGGRGSANSTVDQAIVGAGSNIIANATETGSTVTITTTGVHGHAVNDTVVISGVGVASYNGTFTITSVPTTTSFTYTDAATGLAASSGGTATVGVIILAPPQITKSFGAATIPINGTTTVTFSINNPNVVAIDASFTDNLPTGLQVAATPSVTNTCGGTVGATAGSGQVTFANTLLPIGVCTITLNVTGTVDNSYTNSVQILSTDAGNGNTSSANITVINPPHIVKSFGAATIPLNGTSTLTFTIDSNGNQNLTQTGVAFTDNLPTGLVVATPGNPSTTCSGATLTATNGSSSISLSGASVVPVSSCTVTVNVQGTTAGVKSNSVAVTSTNAGNGNTSTATLTVVAPPTIAKAFGAASIPVTGTTSVTFTLSNPNATVDLTGVAFSDTLPSGLVVASVPAVTNTCGGTVTATAGTGVVSLSGGAITRNTSCTMSLNLTGTSAGDQNNTTGAITSTEGGTGTTSNTATLKIVAPPTISKAFGAATVPLNGTTTVTFTITNPANNTTAENGIAFSDTLTNGLQVASTPGVSNTCGGTVTAAANSTSVSLTGGSIATPGSTCTIALNVTGTQAGTVTNTTGAVSSTNGGTGATSNTATLVVTAPASITKQFGAATIPLNGTTTLTFTIQNPNTSIAQTGLAFTDNLPAGLVVATPANLSNSCSGTSTAASGSSTVSLSGGTLAANATCTVSLNVQGTTAGGKSNSVSVSSNEGGAGNTSTALLTVVAPPTISKAFGAGSIPLNGSTSVTFTLSNPNATVDLTGVAFNDTLPGGLAVASTPSVTNTCGGTVTATAGTGVVSLSGGAIARNTSCTVSLSLTGTAAGDQNNTTGAITSTEGGTGTTSNTATIKVVAPPTISNAFGAASIALNGTTTITFTITNPANNTSAENGIAFSDILTNGLQVASTPGVSNTCGGTVTAAANSTSVSLTGGSIATPGATCTIVLNVTGTQTGTVTNTTGPISSTNGGTGATSNTATLIVAAPPSITKQFGAATIPQNGTTSLTFTIQNPNTNVTLNGVAFNDSLPAGLVVASTPSLTNTCGGTATAVAGSGSASLSGGTLAASATCTMSLNVKATTGGAKNNSVTVTSTEGGTGNTSTASTTVIGSPVIIKAFGAASIPLNGSTSLQFTIQNPNTGTAFTGVAFTDTLPAGLVISTPNGITGSCGSGTITATQGTNSVSLSGGTIAANSQCVFSINVDGTAAGVQNNTTGNVTSTEGGTGGTASASVNVDAPPSIAKVFNPPTIALNGTTSLDFTITNPAANVDPLNGVAFTDTLPAGLTVANATSTVCGGTLTTTAPNTISLTGATIASNSQCQFSVNVTGTASGQYTNTTGSVTSTNGGMGNTASANLSVATPPAITKLFGSPAVPVNGTTSLTFNISNGDPSITQTGIAFTDNLPAGLVVAPSPNLSNTCGGTAIATAGASTVTLSGGTLAAGASCTVSVVIQAQSAGLKNNSVQVSSTEAGAGNTSNASITVGQPPVIIKAFGAASIPVTGSTSLSFTIQNTNTTTGLTGVGFTDALPAGLVISTPNGLTGTCGAGTITATQGTSVVTLSGGNIAASSSCTFSINVTGTAAGAQNNTTGNVTSNEGGNGGTASASVSVEAPPSIAKAFNPARIAVNGTSSLTFTITNPAANANALTGVSFTDTLPVGLTVANATASVCGGTLTTTAPGSISLSNATINVSGQCQFSVTITGAADGSFTNTTGNVASTNGGTGNTASANLFVGSAPTIAKAFGAASIPIGGATTLSFTITNPNLTVGLTGVAFTDNLPAGLVVSTPNGLTGSCGGGTITAAAGSSSVALSGASLAANSSCTFSLAVTGASGGAMANTTGPVSSTQTGPASPSNTATLLVLGPPSIAKAFGAPSIALNGTTTLSFTLTNPNSVASLSGVAFSDTFPAGLLVATPNNLTGSCGGGTITAPSGGGTVTLSGATLPASGTCTFSVDVTGNSAGAKTNTTGNVTSNEGGPGNTATATLTVQVADLTIAKTHSGNFAQGQNGASYSITVSNVGTVATSGTVTVTDTLPSGLTATALGGTGWTCNLGTLTCTRSDALASGGAYPTITLTVNVASTAPPSVTNVAAVSGGGDTNVANNSASDPTTISALGPDLTISKTHPGSFSQGQSGATYTITVSNAGGSTTAGTVTVSDTLPAGLTASAISGTGWSCTLATLTCTRSDALASGGSYPAITLTVNVSASAPASVTNTATVSGGGDVNSANNTASDITAIGAAAIDLAIAKSHAGIFFSGQNGATYTIVVTNSGAVPSAGTVTVTDTLPAGLTATAIAGSGWTCTLATLTCNRSDVLAAGASYPPIAVTVNVASNAPASVTNSATVSGGGDTNPANNTANDVTPIAPSSDIPTLSPEWLVALALALAFLAVRLMKT